MEADRRSARNWYWWLWLSPLLTIPTLVVFFFIDLGDDLVCGGPGRCSWSLASHVNLIISITASSLWHLMLLKPAREKGRPFLRWHGRQALCLAGIRTAVPLFFSIVMGFSVSALVAVLILIAIWFFGTLFGQLQAGRGKCTLASWAGREHELVSRRTPEHKPIPVQERISQPDPEDWVRIIRFSSDPAVRRRALDALRQLGLTEEF